MCQDIVATVAFAWVPGLPRTSDVAFMAARATAASTRGDQPGRAVPHHAPGRRHPRPMRSSGAGRRSPGEHRVLRTRPTRLKGRRCAPRIWFGPGGAGRASRPNGKAPGWRRPGRSPRAARSFRGCPQQAPVGHPPSRCGGPLVAAPHDRCYLPTRERQPRGRVGIGDIERIEVHSTPPDDSGHSLRQWHRTDRVAREDDGCICGADAMSFVIVAIAVA